MKRDLTTAALAAKAIKVELKAAFPVVKFSVKSSNFAGGNSVHICWTDGPKTEAVEAIIKKYQFGHFDPMNDLYEYTNVREDIPQAKYVSAYRQYSEEWKAKAKATFVERWGIDPDDWKAVREKFGDVYGAEREIFRILSEPAA